MMMKLICVAAACVRADARAIDARTASALDPVMDELQRSPEYCLDVARQTLEELKKEVAPVEEEVRGLPFVKQLDSGTFAIGQIQQFACEEFHIISSDTASQELLAQRFGDSEISRNYFGGLAEAERQAFDLLKKLALAVELQLENLPTCAVTAEGQAFPSYMARMAAFRSEGEAAAAMAVNFPLLGEIVGKMASALQKAPFNLSESDVEVLSFFAAENPGFEEASLKVMAEAICKKTSVHQIKRAAVLLQGYEKMFWEMISNKK